jgi:hypothetical protein
MYNFSTESGKVCGLVATKYMILACRSPSIGVQEAEIEFGHSEGRCGRSKENILLSNVTC